MGSAAAEQRFRIRVNPRTLVITVWAIGLLWVIGAAVYYFTPVTRAGFLFHWYRNYERALGDDPGHRPGLLPGVDHHKLTRLGAAALERTTHEIRYDPAYVEIGYPLGDVPADTGVCADVIVRSYRAIGVDLQELIHEDMEAEPSAYPRIWFNRGTDANIDHRRVQNIVVYLLRRGAALPVDTAGAEYRPGDVVVWRMYNRRLHCGIVVDEYAPGAKHRNVVHNIGKGPQSENVLFKWPVMGHFRWTGDQGRRGRACPARNVSGYLSVHSK